MLFEASKYQPADLSHDVSIVFDGVGDGNATSAHSAVTLVTEPLHYQREKFRGTELAGQFGHDCVTGETNSEGIPDDHGREGHFAEGAGIERYVWTHARTVPEFRANALAQAKTFKTT